MKKRFVSMFLCAALSIGMFGAMSYEAKAEETVEIQLQRGFLHSLKFWNVQLQILKKKIRVLKL